jgi:DNA-binding MarR family transcriptional regulator
MARRKDTITLEDPRALRALAHPARQRLINELFGGRILTATEAADLVGLSPSAVSHHLRALEKWGLARRVTGSGDGRERPWEGTASSLRLKPNRGPAGQVAMQSVLSVVMEEFMEQLERFMATADEEPWKGVYQGLARGELWLTYDETRDFTTRMQALIDEFEHGRTHRRHPKASRRTAFTVSLIPVEPAPGPAPEGAG